MSVPFLFWLVNRHSWAKTDASVRGALLLVVAAHCLISFANAYIVSLPGSDGDAYSFHQRARKGQLDFYHGGAARYVNGLNRIYGRVGDSKFLGQQLSVVAFTLALLLFLDPIRRLGLEPRAPSLIRAFGLLPAVMIFTSMTLRESYLILLILATVVWVFRIAFDGSLVGYGVVLGSCLAMASLHKAMVPFSLLLLLASAAFLFLSAGTRKSHPVFVLVQIFVAVGLIFGGVAQKDAFSGSSQVLQALEEGSTGELVDHYRSTDEGRAVYAVTLDLSSVGGLLRTGPAVFFLYMFCPFPWQVETPLDLYGCLESMFRGALIFGSILFILKAQGAKRLIAMYLFGLFLGMELIWAAGTTNWGTAVRHHTVLYFVIALLGPPLFLGELQPGARQEASEKRRRRRTRRPRRRPRRGTPAAVND